MLGALGKSAGILLFCYCQSMAISQLSPISCFIIAKKHAIVTDEYTTSVAPRVYSEQKTL
jgi:hypothetical protein